MCSTPRACRQKANPGLIFLNRQRQPFDNDNDDEDYAPNDSDGYDGAAPYHRPRRPRSYSHLHVNFEDVTVAHLEELNKCAVKVPLVIQC